MWRKSSQSVDVAKNIAARSAQTLDALLKLSGWEQLGDVERAQASARFPALDQRAEDNAPLLRAASSVPIQDWLATIAGTPLQPHIVEGFQSWIETAPDAANLYVGGSVNLGTPHLIASLSRKALENWPLPSSYCYVPDPAALTTPLLLTLPLGTGKAFVDALTIKIAVLFQQWSDAANRQAAITANIGELRDAVPPMAKDYLDHLCDALLQLAVANADFPWDDGDNSPPLAAVLPEPTVKRGAPTVDGTDGTSSVGELLLRANGGVLIVSPTSVDLDKLFTALDMRKVPITDGGLAVPLNIKVVMIGTGDMYESLWSSSELAPQLFRFEIWSQSVVPWTHDTEAAYAAFAGGVAHYYSLPELTSAAVGHLIQEGARRTDGINRGRLSCNLLMLHDIVIQAGKFAKSRGATTVTGDDIDSVLEQRRAPHRVNKFWVHEAILSGESITPTSGKAVGQINGLGILDVHPWEAIFAVPTRISATVAPGRDEQLLDIEREAEQADGSHVAGLLTMEGYFANKYGQNYPLSLTARIRFEQEHGATGGDSASAAELFALLSALTGIPINRSIAVTGAVGQYGELQPIGGVNIKIEGFWDLCNVRRKLGEQPEGGYGVIIPATNARDLMLRAIPARSIATEGWFRIWLVDTVDEAIPLLMGVPATIVHERVEQRLRLYHQLSQSSYKNR
jgi:AAA domain/Lon protease (S16) C-terminal proteolytic domain